MQNGLQLVRVSGTEDFSVTSGASSQEKYRRGMPALFFASRDFLFKTTPTCHEIDIRSEIFTPRIIHPSPVTHSQMHHLTSPHPPLVCSLRDIDSATGSSQTPTGHAYPLRNISPLLLSHHVHPFQKNPQSETDLQASSASIKPPPHTTNHPNL